MHSKFKTCFFLLFMIWNEIGADGNAPPKLKAIHCADDYPSHKDLHSLMHSLGKIINFSLAHCKQLSLDIIFGLFFVDVNLRFTNLDSMQQSYQIHLKSLLSTTHKSISCFYANNLLEDNNKYAKISTLFRSETLWYTRQKSLKIEKKQKQKIPIVSELQGYPDWSAYARIVMDFNSSNPNPHLSDSCLTKLAENEENISARPKNCRIPQVCYDMLTDGSNHGYALTHRLLLLIAAHFGRGCTIFSPQQDKAMRDKFCEIIYVEAHYIADHGFSLVDLLMEQIALCALDGHSEFISRPWLYGMQRYQTQHGCFHEPMTTRYFGPGGEIVASSPRRIYKDSRREFVRMNNLLNGTCNAHVTAVAAASISASIRFILENDDILFVRCRT